ncbi:hypothetical protein LR48_Vigan10g233000 [Vigna angularis]|uniref:Uncharacterized protein n=1 Tax=Phaseolus angularis TaxID=3914 RepID=A0A0L9VND0_PHAAN|nr:hypothetical protein LR48_Vigan10g233000 [Vigna angularis]
MHPCSSSSCSGWRKQDSNVVCGGVRLRHAAAIPYSVCAVVTLTAPTVNFFSPMIVEGLSDGDSLQFDLATIEAATNRFSDENKIGKGGFGVVYKAWKKWTEQTPMEFVDPTLRGSCSRNEVNRCIRYIGLLCVQENPSDRPSMATIALMLNSYSVTMSMPRQPASFLRGRNPNRFNRELDSDQSTTDQSTSCSILNLLRLFRAYGGACGESIVEPVVEPMKEYIMVYSLVVSFVNQSQLESNPDNVCVVHGYSIVKNLDVSIGSGVLMDSDSLANMSSLEDVTLIVNNLQGLQYLNSSYSNSKIFPNSLTSKEAHFVEELKLTSKLTNMLDEKDDSITHDDKPVQTTKKPSRG